MRKFLIRTGLVLGLMLFAVTAVLADSHVYKLYVDGLACPFCAYGVEKHVGGLDNVTSVEILINEGIVAVTMASGKTLDEANAKQGDKRLRIHVTQIRRSQRPMIPPTVIFSHRLGAKSLGVAIVSVLMMLSFRNPDGRGPRTHFRSGGPCPF